MKARSLTITAIVVTIIVAAAALIGTAQAGPAAKRTASDATTYWAYLPAVVRAPGEIYGRVTQNGAAAAGVAVKLRRYSGTNWAVVSTVNTEADGKYRFVGPEALGASQKYQVVFDNTPADSNRLAWWGTRQLSSYTLGAMVEIGNFDIAAVQLNAPDTNAVVGLPATFRWTKRAGVPGDSYALRVYDSADLNPMYVAPYVGYNGEYTVSSLPAGCSANTAYTWDVVLQSADGGTGVSQQARTVTVAAGIYGRVTENGAGAGGVLLQLRYFNGSAWTTRITTTTQANGYYLFSGAPALAAGQKYYVRYQNVAQTEGRLFLWSTRTLTAYAAGAGVDLGSFDIADVALGNPAGGALVTLPAQFTWTRRPSTPSDSYAIEIYDPADYDPRWLSPLEGYSQAYTLSGLPAAFGTQTQYAWDVIISAPDGGSGVSRLARLVRFANRGSGGGVAEEEALAWPFEEPLPERPAESYVGGE